MPSGSVSRMYDVNLNVDSLELLLEGSRGVNREMLAYHSQAAALCLQKQGHNSPKEGKVGGDWSGPMSISWKRKEQKSLENVWENEHATELGATVIALSLVAHKNYKVSKRAQRRDSNRRTGFDYWLENNSNNPSGFEDRVRLEVSGILRGTGGQINQRVREKAKRIQRLDNPDYRAIILIVEFSNPRVQVCQRQ